MIHIYIGFYYRNVECHKIDNLVHNRVKTQEPANIGWLN
jgi:hypothetical protein